MPLAAACPPSPFLSQAKPGWPVAESREDTGPAGQQLVTSVGHTGCSSQPHSRSGPGRGKTA